MDLFDIAVARKLSGGGGGGGGSDFSTATVTMSCNGGSGYEWNYSGFYLEDDRLTSGTSYRSLNIIQGHDINVYVPLFKGKAELPFDFFLNAGDGLPIISGSISMDMERFVMVVTGDGTITCEGIEGQ